MNLVLKSFQEQAVADLLGHVDSARFEASRGTLQALSLASPTGSGKTVILTRLIELVLEGDDERSGDPEATFLWVTDQPELNEQTRAKMLATSSVLGPTRLRVIGPGFDQESLSAGRVYFLNTQKLGRNSTLVRDGDRNHTLWQTIANTIQERPTHFYVVIDEAHRGMQQGEEREEASSIMQKFIKGSGGEMPPAPMVIAVSATIERFNEVVSQTPHVKRPVEVSIEEVRASGLLKEVVNLYHADEDRPSDITLLREAARTYLDFCTRWDAYGASGGETVRPIMLVQVQDGRRGQVSSTDLEAVLSALRDELGPLSNNALAHAFQEGAGVPVGASTIRYLAPSAIDRDQHVRVVLFKTSLNLGWDCPRAEVMMSFRSAREAVLIAQLVGRMVRAPLARPVESDEHLNTVALYLPHYDRAGLRNVIARLQADEPVTHVQEGSSAIVLSRMLDSDRFFNRLAGLPSFVIPRQGRVSQVRRLAKMASLLSRSGIDVAAPETVEGLLTQVLLDEFEARKNLPAFERVVRASGVITVRRVEWRYDPSTMRDDTVDIAVSDENVDDLFAWAGRELHEGLHIAYWRRRLQAGASDHRRTKLEVYALANSEEVLARLESTAQQQVREMFSTHAAAIQAQPDSVQSAFTDVRAIAARPEPAGIVYPQCIEWTVEGDRTYGHHLYQDSSGSFRCRTTSWEAATLNEELSRADILAWLRNPDRKPWSLCVPYEPGATYKGCYPDFIVIRDGGDRLIVDIVDPHLLTYDDAWQRARGLAQYAASHSDSFGRIDMIRVNDGKVERLDLCDEATRGHVLRVTSNEHLRDVFDSRHYLFQPSE